MSAEKPNRTFSAIPKDVRDWTTFLSELFYEGEFDAALLGCTTQPSGIARYTVSAGIVCLSLPGLTGTSNSATAFISGLPEEITPQHDQQCLARIVDSSVTAIGIVQIGVDTGITLFKDLDGFNSTTFTSSGTKGLRGSILCYPLD